MRIDIGSTLCSHSLMEKEVSLQAQRSDGNVFAFRRLKWGDPPARFRVNSIRRRGFTGLQSPARPPNTDGTAADTEVDAQLMSNPGADPQIASLGRRRMRDRQIDAAVWGVALACVASLIAALVWTGWST